MLQGFLIFIYKLKFSNMILSIVLIVVGLIVVVALFQAKAKNTDSNGPMDNN